jgi:hypothetical protein
MTWKELEKKILDDLDKNYDDWDAEVVKDLVIAGGIAHDKAKDDRF